MVEASRFSSAFTFQYSQRPGTPAATMDEQLPKAVVQERYERLTALQDRIAKEENAKQLGRTVEVMVTEHAGRKAETTHRLSGRSQDQRLVHFSVPEGAETPRPGDLVTLPITEVAAFHLVSDPTASSTSCAVHGQGMPGTARRPTAAVCRPPGAAASQDGPTWGCRP